MVPGEKAAYRAKCFRTDSGKSNHPHRHWYMTTAKQCIDFVSEMNNENAISFARKSWIRCGLPQDLDRIWLISPLPKQLQIVVQSYPKTFKVNIQPI